MRYNGRDRDSDREFDRRDRRDNAAQEPLRSNLFARNGADEAGRPRLARRHSHPRADCRMGRADHRSGSDCWLRGRRSPAIGSFRHGCGGRRRAALGDARGPARLPYVYPQDFLRYADRGSLRSLLLYGSVWRLALDLDPKSRDFLLSCSNAVRRGVFIRGSATHCRPRSLVSADCRLCGRLSCHGNRVHSWGRTSGIVPIWRS